MNQFKKIILIKMINKMQIQKTNMFLKLNN